MGRFPSDSHVTYASPIALSDKCTRHLWVKIYVTYLIVLVVQGWCKGGAKSFVIVSNVCPLGKTTRILKLSFGLNFIVCTPSPRNLINRDVNGVGVSVIDTLNNTLFAAGLFEYKADVFDCPQAADPLENSTYKYG